LTHYSLDTDSSTLFVQGLNVTKNAVRQGTIVNNYIPLGDLLVNKEILNDGEPDSTDEGKTFKVAVYSDAQGTAMIGEPQTFTIHAGTGQAAGKYVGSTTFTDLPYGIYYVFELDDNDEPITGNSGTIDDVVYEVMKDGTSVRVGDDTAIVNILNNQQPPFGKITVTKTVQLNGEIDQEAEGSEFWCMIYNDVAAENPVPGQTSKKITIGDSGSGTVEFVNLPVGTYYVFELTEEDGEPVTGPEGIINGAEYEVTTDNSDAVITKEDLEGMATVVNNRHAKIDVKIVKVDSEDMVTPLKGAKFQMTRIESGEETTVYHVFENDAFEEVESEVIDPETGEKTTVKKKTGEFEIKSEDGITITGLTPGNYKMEETKSPTGYVKMVGEIIFTIESNGTVEYDDSATDLVKYETEDKTFKVGNTKGTALPNTGGSGTSFHYLLGSFLALMAGALLLLRKKRVL